METSSRATGGTPVTNVPVALPAPAGQEELARLFGSALPDAAFLIEPTTWLLAGANAKLLELLDHPSLDLECEVSFREFVYPDDRSVFQTLIQEELSESSPSFETRFLRSDGSPISVEVVVRPVCWKGRECFLGFARPCGDRQRRELWLRRQLDQQKGRAMEALTSSLRVYQLNEKIKSTLVLTTRLLNVENEEQLYRESVELLTSEEGMNFREATVLIPEGT